MISATQLDTTIEIVTPENISFRYEIVGPFRRLPAFALDLSIRFIAIFITFFIISLLGFVVGPGAFAILLIAWFVLEWFYGALFETYFNGQTPGKRIMGIRVVSTSGHPITGLQAVMRNILRGVDMMPLVPATILDQDVIYLVVPTFFLGFISQTLNSRFQRIGDIVCGTMVVVDERRRRRTFTNELDPQHMQILESIPGSFVVNQQLQRALATYVERRGRMALPRRREIARHLAAPLILRFGLPDSTSFDILLCALYDREQQRNRRQPARQDAPRAERAFAVSEPAAPQAPTSIPGEGDSA